ncbi:MULTISPECIES: glycosyltransferase family 2 protein [unclassified Paenibacillus]|uniref:glycosyltransferase family 2 protein n=1 Tax=unclassified Paenibacillus TaxID=185978 RepID=UPI00083878C9|nr:MULTISPECIES: glycosyltransferase [unclassified Paenibacillus]NWL88840.1 glycosyl transferase [Paenibacillus sp. 79R4]
MNPLVTIVIPFYNCSYVNQAIESALHQTYSNIEIIVVDDGSTSHQELVAPYMHRVHYLGKANGGTATALNHGIRYASGDYIAWLSSDDLFTPDKIKKQVQFMIKHKALISHTNFHYIDDLGRITHANVVPNNMFNDLQVFYRTFLTSNPVNGCTVMIRRDVFRQIGLFNESLRYTHDLDFWQRVVLSGIRFPFLNESLTMYRWHDGMGTLRYTDAVHMEYNQVQGRAKAAIQKLIRRKKGAR